MKPERIEELREEAEYVRAGHPATPKFVPVDAAELLHMLRCARVVAEMEAWLETDARRSIRLRINGVDSSILTVIEAALARAKDGGA